MKSSHHLNILLSKAWNKILAPVANWLNTWQNKVSLKTRNRWVLSILGLLFMYGLLSLITLFF